MKQHIKSRQHIIPHTHARFVLSLSLITDMLKLERSISTTKMDCLKFSQKCGTPCTPHPHDVLFVMVSCCRQVGAGHHTECGQAEHDDDVGVEAGRVGCVQPHLDVGCQVLKKHTARRCYTTCLNSNNKEKKQRITPQNTHTHTKKQRKYNPTKTHKNLK